jgi:hypothetical protein
MTPSYVYGSLTYEGISRATTRQSRPCLRRPPSHPREDIEQFDALQLQLGDKAEHDTEDDDTPGPCDVPLQLGGVNRTWMPKASEVCSESWRLDAQADVPHKQGAASVNRTWMPKASEVCSESWRLAAQADVPHKQGATAEATAEAFSHQQEKAAKGFASGAQEVIHGSKGGPRWLHNGPRGGHQGNPMA